MENFFDVKFKVHNKEADSWAAQIAYTTKDERDARAHFHSECSRLFGSSDFDFVCVTMSDTYGNSKSDFIDERVAPEPPEPNTEA